MAGGAPPKIGDKATLMSLPREVRLDIIRNLTHNRVMAAGVIPEDPRLVVRREQPKAHFLTRHAGRGYHWPIMAANRLLYWESKLIFWSENTWVFWANGPLVTKAAMAPNKDIRMEFLDFGVKGGMPEEVSEHMKNVNFIWCINVEPNRSSWRLDGGARVATVNEAMKAFYRPGGLLHQIAELQNIQKLFLRIYPVGMQSGGYGYHSILPDLSNLKRDTDSLKVSIAVQKGHKGQDGWETKTDLCLLDLERRLFSSTKDTFPDSNVEMVFY